MNIEQLILKAAQALYERGKISNSTRWQGIPLQNPLFQAIKVYLGPADMPESLKWLVEQTKPNLPWVEEHFKERIGGKPLNPGETYKQWPFYKMDEKMRTEGEQFTHTYMERFWPKHAGLSNEAYEKVMDLNTTMLFKGRMGIRYEYGDLNDVIKMFLKDPETRQAYLPIWFPEDTGALHGGRVPCTLGYLFQIVDDKLHMTYYIRSCDYYRHFRDDIYLAIMLARYVLMSLKMSDSRFTGVSLGEFDMHIGSLHIFNAEVNKLKKEIF